MHRTPPPSVCRAADADAEEPAASTQPEEPVAHPQPEAPLPSEGENPESGLTVDEELIQSPPSGKLGAVTRKQHDIELLLISEPLDIPKLKTHYSVYLQRVEALCAACGEEHKAWLEDNFRNISEFRRKMDEMLYPSTVKSASVVTGSTNSSTSARLRLLEKKAKAVAKKEMFNESAKIRLEELKLKAKHEEEKLKLQLRKEELENNTLVKELTIIEGAACEEPETRMFSTPLTLGTMSRSPICSVSEPRHVITFASSTSTSPTPALPYDSRPTPTPISASFAQTLPDIEEITAAAGPSAARNDLSVQLDIAKAISQVNLDTALPKRELQKFDGSDITKFKSFVINFDRIISSRCPDDGDKLLFLQQFTTGKAKRLVDGCVHYDPTASYRKHANF